MGCPIGHNFRLLLDAAGGPTMKCTKWSPQWPKFKWVMETIMESRGPQRVLQPEPGLGNEAHSNLPSKPHRYR